MIVKRNNEPRLILAIGLPGSGIEQMIDKTKVVSGSTDYTVVYHNLNDELKRAIKADLRDGANVIVNASMLSRRQRVAFLTEFKNIDCERTCLCIASPYEHCIKYASEKDVKNAYMEWAPPGYAEGFDDIQFLFNAEPNELDNYTLNRFIQTADNFDQESKHHNLTLGEHCKQTASYIADKYPNDNLLLLSALLHDNGKEYVKTYVNAKGQIDDKAHYYQHNNAGAYNSMFYTKAMGLNKEAMLDVANAIYFHMHHRMVWKQSQKAMIRDQKSVSERVFDMIKKINEADMFAHKPTACYEHQAIHNLMKQSNYDINIDRSE